MVLVDQFEEVFTLCHDEAERRDFIACLLHAATVSGGRSIVVLTMRADFYPRCASHSDLAAALSDHQVLVGPMTEDELRRAIDRPARLAGLEPESGLVELLVDDVRGRPGALPLLQFALQEVWRRREDYRLTIRTYRAIGQIEGALQRKADAVFATFTDDQKELCRRIFLRLVQPGEGSEDTRRRASLHELLPNDPAQAEAVEAIIGRLTDPESRLLTADARQTASGEGTLEVAHEALIRGWPQLRKWVDNDRAGLRTHLRLTDAAKEWADAATEAKDGTLFTVPAWPSRANGRQRTETSLVPWKRPSCQPVRNTNVSGKPTRRRRTDASPKPSGKGRRRRNSLLRCERRPPVDCGRLLPPSEACCSWRSA